MPTGQVSVAAATAVVGFDMFEDEWFQISPRHRVFTLIGVAGSAAALDSLGSLFIGTTKVGEFYNSATGMVLIDAHGLDIEAYCPPGEKVHFYIDDAPATNPLNIVIQWDEY